MRIWLQTCGSPKEGAGEEQGRVLCQAIAFCFSRLDPDTGMRNAISIPHWGGGPQQHIETVRLPGAIRSRSLFLKPAAKHLFRQAACTAA